MKDLILTETQKMWIIIVAASLFLLSVILTVCAVSPMCFLNRYIFKTPKKKSGDKYEKVLMLESKHFQLKVVPLYGTNCDNKKIPCPNIKALDQQTFVQSPKIWIGVYYTDLVDRIKVNIKIDKVENLQMKEYGVEPNCYVLTDILSNGKCKTRKKSNLGNINTSFKTSNTKKSLNPEFNEEFVSSEFPKSIVKEGRLRIKVMDDEKYANDICLGELVIPLKQISDVNSNNEDFIQCHELKPLRQYKAELLIGICYLPTSRRVTISALKATLNIQVTNTNFYVRMLMFMDGKLIRKRKTSISEKLTWQDKEPLTFDLTDGNLNDVAYMIVLSTSNDTQGSLSSPSSPESPNISSSRKERHIGHSIIGQSIWKEMKQQPRKKKNIRLPVANT